jgi:hypothetical protein
MTTMTKHTIIEWVSPEANDGAITKDGTSLWAEREEKLNAMQAEGKTDLVWESVSDAKTKRSWLDQAAAQEFVDFIMTMDAKYGPGLVISTEIVDIV